MLRRYAPFQTHHRHLNLTDSETESDDRSELVSNNIIGQKGYNKSSGGGGGGVYVGKTGTGRERHQNKRRKKKGNDVHGDDDDIKLDEESDHKMIRKAEKYQEYMKMIPIPSSSSSSRESPIIPFITWEGLAKSMYQIHKQPLHYLTHRLLKQWDQSRIGSAEETKRLDLIIHPTTAEATLWGIEEFHRLCSSHHYLAQLWLSDPHYYEIVDPVVP